MYLSHIKLLNYRNISSLSIDLDPRVNIFVGDNAQGKTNLLESIFLLGRGKSYRSSTNDLIMWNKEQSSVDGFFLKDNMKDHIKIIINNSNMNITFNDKKILKKNALSSKFYMILFSPEDLKLIKEGPENRRKFLDNELSLIKPSYGQLIKDYNKVLFQRNNLLKSFHKEQDKPDTLEIWNEQLVHFGSKIIRQRISFLKKINDLTKKIHGELTKNREELQLFYISNLIKNKNDLDDLENVYKQKIKHNFNLDFRKGYTSIGPHLDDIKVNINQYDVKLFGSQGQQRTVALSLKLSEIQLIQQEKGENPIILLDDVMSELDSKRQEEIIKYFKDLQVFITCTEFNFGNYLQNHIKKIYTIHRGKIENVN